MILYDAVGVGMSAFARARLRVEVEGTLSAEPGTLYVATHRSHLDVPLLVGALYPRVWRRRDALPWFAARDDLFVPGFFAHLAPGRLPLGLGMGRLLEHGVRCLPIRPATRMRLVDLCRAEPELPLEALPHADDLRARAGGRELRVAGDALRSAYADILWRLVQRSEAPAAEGAWALRVAQARLDLERLTSLLRDGGSLVVFPEGTPSKDGRVGPVQRGTGLLVRRGRPRRIVPLGIDYRRDDARRRRAVVRVGTAIPPPAGDVEATVHALLRSAVGEAGRAA